MVRYKWAETMETHNEGLRAARDLHWPLIYFYVLHQGVYLPLYPVYVVGEDETLCEFHVIISETLGPARSDFSLQH